jgi:hypothetical protein
MLDVNNSESAALGPLQRLDRYLAVNRDVAAFALLFVYLILLSAMTCASRSASSGSGC